MTVTLPDELAERARRQADRRGVSIDQVVTEALAKQLPDETAADALEAFIGSGASGKREPFDIHEARSELAKRKFAQGI